MTDGVLQVSDNGSLVTEMTPQSECAWCTYGFADSLQ